jgi:hypothetical protein
MKELINRVWEFARSHIAAPDNGSNAHEEESWLGI